jgi:hypothetical protein
MQCWVVLLLLAVLRLRPLLQQHYDLSQVF